MFTFCDIGFYTGMCERSIREHIAHAVVTVELRINQLIANMCCPCTAAEFEPVSWRVGNVQLFYRLGDSLISIAEFFCAGTKSKIQDGTYFISFMFQLDTGHA